jgi:hypothetical protein
MGFGGMVPTGEDRSVRMKTSAISPTNSASRTGTEAGALLRDGGP